MTGKPLLILECDDLATGQPDLHAVRGGMADFFIRAAGQVFDPGSLVVTRVWHGEAPPDPENVGGVIITGAAAMVADPEPWIDATRDWLRRAADHGLPILGVCFGHQLLADLFGGMVASTPGGPEYGTIAVQLTPAGLNDPLTAHLPADFTAQSAHFESVVRAPEGALVLAESKLAIQAMRYTPTIWGVQFHPEFEADDVAMIARSIAPSLSAAGCEVAPLLAGLESAPASASLIQRFVTLVEKEPAA
jgi:GMP synthase (glutamine-hydrolysing)